RVYRTGDLARYLPDGRVECLGRIDNQVKLRGFRIEPGEVETILRQHTAIADALVTTRDDAFGEKRLVGYLISKNGAPSTSELRDFMQTKLPPYMIPAQFVVLTEFPVTPNGKLDVRRLPPPDANRASVKNYVPPRNADEVRLSEIWQEVLTLQRIG